MEDLACSNQHIQIWMTIHYLLRCGHFAGKFHISKLASIQMGPIAWLARMIAKASQDFKKTHYLCAYGARYTKRMETKCQNSECNQGWRHQNLNLYKEWMEQNETLTDALEILIPVEPERTIIGIKSLIRRSELEIGQNAEYF